MAELRHRCEFYVRVAQTERGEYFFIVFEAVPNESPETRRANSMQNRVVAQQRKDDIFSEVMKGDLRGNWPFVCVAKGNDLNSAIKGANENTEEPARPNKERQEEAQRLNGERRRRRRVF